MTQYRKKPIVIDAEQWFEGGSLIDGMAYNKNTGHYYIETLEGYIRVSNGDWIITGVEGKKDVCGPVIFAKTYTPILDPKYDMDIVNKMITEERDEARWKDGPYSEFYKVRWAYTWRTRGILSEAEIKRLQEKIAKLRYFARQVVAVYELNYGSDILDTDWLEDLGEAAKEVLND